MKTLKILLLFVVLSTLSSINNIDACNPFTDESPTLLNNGYYLKKVESIEPFWFATYIDNTFVFYSRGTGNQLLYKTSETNPVVPPNTVTTIAHVVAVNYSDGYECFEHALDSLGLNY